MELEKIYKRRFEKEVIFRDGLYKLLCSNFFQKYVSESSTILEVASGYCEFINNIKAKKKIALDFNSDAKKFANKEVDVLISDSTRMDGVRDSSVDVVYISNFLEHLTKPDIIKTIKEIYRVLRAGGKIILLQPNIRYCYKDYWMFFDHVTPLDDRSLCEVLEINGFNIVKCIPRFLPYTTKNNFPKNKFLIWLYLKFPIFWKILGGQTFIYAKKKIDLYE